MASLAGEARGGVRAGDRWFRLMVFGDLLLLPGLFVVTRSFMLGPLSFD